MNLIEGIAVWGEPDPGALAQIKRCAGFADHVALMADNHKGYGVPIGGVLASREYVSPTDVGYDIGCGNKAVLTDMPGASSTAASGTGWSARAPRRPSRASAGSWAGRWATSA